MTTLAAYTTFHNTLAEELSRQAEAINTAVQLADEMRAELARLDADIISRRKTMADLAKQLAGVKAIIRGIEDADTQNNREKEDNNIAQFL